MNLYNLTTYARPTTLFRITQGKAGLRGGDVRLPGSSCGLPILISHQLAKKICQAVSLQTLLL
ncbi:MAG: hypothetical protein OHK0047_33200 [Leptolyngbyaceae cyanobacterium]